MDVKVKAKIREVEAPYGIGIGLFSLATMLFNCVMCLCMCYLAWAKDWWATLLLIPCCTLTPSYKTKSHKSEDTEDKNNE